MPVDLPVNLSVDPIADHVHRRPLVVMIAAAMLMPGLACAEVPKVVTDIPPVESLVAMVMGDLGQPVLLMDKGADAHDYQLRPSQAAALEGADLLVWVGPEMTPWLDGQADARDPATVLGLLALPGTHTRAFPKTAGEAPEEADADGHHHSGMDPHAWLDPTNAQSWIAGIAAALAAKDPDNAAAYRANADAAQAALAALDQRMIATLLPARGKPILTGHDAYGYFADHFGLTIAGTVAEGHAALPGAARLSELRQSMSAQNVVCAYPETGQDTRLMDAVTEGSAVRIGGALDPEGRGQDPGAGQYVALMTQLADTIAACVKN